MKAFAILASTVVATYLSAGRPLAELSLANACPGIATNGEVVDGDGCLVLNVTFIGRRPSNAAVDKAGRAYLSAVIKKFNRQDILVASWFRTHAKRSPDFDDQIHAYSGFNRSGGVVTHRALVFRSKTGKIAVE